MTLDVSSNGTGSRSYILPIATNIKYYEHIDSNSIPGREL